MEVQNEYIAYEKNMGITLWVWWFQNKLFYVMAVLSVIYVFLRFDLIRFDLQKAAYVLFPSFWFYKRYYVCH